MRTALRWALQKRKRGDEGSTETQTDEDRTPVTLNTKRVAAPNPAEILAMMHEDNDEPLPYAPVAPRFSSRDAFHPLQHPRGDTGLDVGKDGVPALPPDTYKVVPNPHNGVAREVGLPFPTDRETWNTRPDEWPGVVWAKVQKLRWTDGKQTIDPAAGTFQRVHPDYYGLARAYLSEGKVPEGLYRTSLKRFLENMRTFRWYEAKSEIVLLDYDVSPKYRGHVPTANPVLADHHNRNVYLYIVVPESRQLDYLEKYYPDPRVNAHRGRDSFYDHIRDYFLGIPRSAIDAFIKNKEQAQLLGRQEGKKVTSPLRTEYPMQHWQVDLFDMRFAQLSNRNAAMVMVVIDCFSKFIYLRFLKTKSDEEVAWHLMQIFFQDGPPEILQSDNGNEFMGKVNQLCREFKVERRFGREYNPSSQGQVERTNRTLKNSIYADFMRYDKEVYADWLQHYAFTYNTTRQRTTGFSPMMLHRMRPVFYLPANPVGGTPETPANDNMQRGEYKETTETEILNALSPRARTMVLEEAVRIEFDKTRVNHLHGGGPPPVVLPLQYSVAADYISPGEQAARTQQEFEDYLVDPPPDERKPFLTHTFLVQYVEFCTFPPVDPEGYMRREVDAKGARERKARLGINRGADAMIDRFMIKQHTEFTVGDMVRVDHNARENFSRHRANKSIHYQPKARKWSNLIYMIDRKMSAHGNTSYHLVTLPDRAPIDDLKHGYELYKVGGIEVGDIVRLDLAAVAKYYRKLFSSAMIANHYARWTKALYRVTHMFPVDASHEPKQLPGESDDKYKARLRDWVKNVGDAQDEVAPPDTFNMYRVEFLKSYQRADGATVDLSDTFDQRDERIVDNGTLFTANNMLKIDADKLSRSPTGVVRPDLVYGYTGAMPRFVVEGLGKRITSREARSAAHQLSIPDEQYVELLRDLKVVREITDEGAAEQDRQAVEDAQDRAEGAPVRKSRERKRLDTLAEQNEYRLRKKAVPEFQQPIIQKEKRVVRKPSRFMN